jgi:hypothetical protein
MINVPGTVQLPHSDTLSAEILTPSRMGLRQPMDALGRGGMKGGPVQSVDS